MPGIARVTDIGSSHESWIETQIIEGSPTSTLDSLAIARDGDALESHTSTANGNTHSRHINGGVSNVFLESRLVAIIGTPIDCGGTIITGSNVTIGD
jgi:uncharacterized Zn-binding protein involved in type VI secretion